MSNNLIHLTTRIHDTSNYGYITTTHAENRARSRPTALSDPTRPHKVTDENRQERKILKIIVLVSIGAKRILAGEGCDDVIEDRMRKGKSFSKWPGRFLFR
jgi:hypothetical protein